MYENKQEEQTAVLAAIDTGEYDAQRSMDELEELARPGDLILTVGAGDIYRAGEKLLSETEG